MARLAAMVPALALVLAGCSSDTPTAGEGGEGGEDGELTTVRVAIGNLRSIQYFPFYLADAAGFFEDEGIDVELEIVSGGQAVAQQLIAGNFDVALVGTTPILQGVSQGHDIVTFYTTHHQNIFDLAAPTENGISSIEDLSGQVVGISEPSGGEVPLVRAAMSSAGLTDGEDYELLAIGDGGQLTFEALRTGQAQAYSSSVYDVAAIESAGIPLTRLLPDEFLFVPSTGLHAMRETFDDEKDMLVRFGRAYAKGQVLGDNLDREAANEMLSENDPENFEDPDLAEAIWEATLRLMTPPPELEGEPLGTHYIPGWEIYVEAASEAAPDQGGLANPIDIDKAADGSLIEEINDFDQQEIIDEANS